MKKFVLALSLFCLLNQQLMAVVNETDPPPPPPRGAYPTAARSGERSAITKTMLAANVGVIAVLVVLALSNSNSHAH